MRVVPLSDAEVGRLRAGQALPDRVLRAALGPRQGDHDHDNLEPRTAAPDRDVQKKHKPLRGCNAWSANDTGDGAPDGRSPGYLKLAGIRSVDVVLQRMVRMHAAT